MTPAEIERNVKNIRAEIARAAGEAGRDPDEILLAAATKTNGAEAVRAAVKAGVDICGENRVQEMLEKNELGAYDGVPLHFIGHLQKNKVRQVVGLCALIHSADSLPLLQEISRIAEKRGLVQDVLLEINIGNEASKSGFRPEELESVLEEAARFPALRVRGLMAIPPICAKPEDNRPFFLQMQKLFVDNRQKKYDNIRMDFLSMGMSGDFAEAVRCGANLVRIGSGIFGPRNTTTT
ncbi:MAG: YggS family pyridoxal phosphate-dependent enzyme [Oscillospiraceae bacterium]|nr:YggS family pyridoxal phosphate-dependent enzyme [Oscillospiraceae bacterium]